MDPAVNGTQRPAVKGCHRLPWPFSDCSHTKQLRASLEISRVLRRLALHVALSLPHGPGGPTNAGMPGGGLGDLLSSGLGGLLASGAAGGVLSGGLNELLKQFQQSGQGDVAKSWVGTGPNKSISPNDLAKTLGADQIDTLMAQTGMSRDELIAGLSQVLPEVVDKLTPQGRVPTEQELSRSL